MDFTQKSRWWWLPWVLALGVCVWALAAFRFGSADPDSEFYAFLVKQINDKPIWEWMAPDWLWRQNIPEGEVVRDHLIGHLVPPTLLSRLGYPSGQAIYAWNLFYVLACLWAIAALVREYVPGIVARAQLWALQILPIAFLYRVRANHEQLVLLCVLLGALGGARMRRHWGWVFLVLLATHVLFFVKGVVFVMAPAAAGLVILAHFYEMSWRKIGQIIFLLALCAASVAASAVAYEMAFRAVAGQPFFEAYWGYQIVGRSVNINETHPWVVRKAINFVYYLSSSIWYAMPWTLAFLSAGWVFVCNLRQGSMRLGGKGFARLREWMGDPQFQVHVILVGVALEYIFLFSLSNRLAGRYIFPAFFFLAASAFLLSWSRWSWLRSFGNKIEGWGVHRLSALLWGVLTWLSIVYQNAGD